jgi:tetratricopeptide (TPR) repeat protein
VLAACASRGPTLPAGGPAAESVVELADTPFFPQEIHQCGPAALATVLATADANVRLAELSDQVYLPTREGSLQLELLAATRRQGLLPYTLEPGVEALLAEVRARRPVLVLQNLGLDALPVWHYAVVIGFDLGADKLVLRSGTVRREVLSAHRFVTAWQRAGYWAFVALKPGELPARPERGRYLRAVTALEAVGQTQAALAGYRIALVRWPEDPVAQLGLGNSLYELGRLDEARAAFERLLAGHPNHIPGHNNLAQVHAEQGNYRRALALVARGLALSAQDPEMQRALRATRAEIEQRRREGRTDQPNGPGPMPNASRPK